MHGVDGHRVGQRLPLALSAHLGLRPRRGRKLREQPRQKAKIYHKQML